MPLFYHNPALLTTEIVNRMQTGALKKYKEKRQTIGTLYYYRLFTAFSLYLLQMFR
jgi:hypothetical protein